MRSSRPAAPRRALVAPSLAAASLAAASLAAALGCGSSGSGTVAAGAAPTPVRVDAPSGRQLDISILQSDPTGRFPLRATPDAVWAVMPAVYAELDIPVTTLVTSQKRIGNTGYRVRRRLAGERMSRFLSCGERLGQMVADTDDITLHVETVVTPGDSGAALTTVIAGSARPMGVSGHPINCATTGMLEQRIVGLVQAKLPR